MDSLSKLGSFCHFNICLFTNKDSELVFTISITSNRQGLFDSFGSKSLFVAPGTVLLSFSGFGEPSPEELTSETILNYFKLQKAQQPSLNLLALVIPEFLLPLWRKRRFNFSSLDVFREMEIECSRMGICFEDCLYVSTNQEFQEHSVAREIYCSMGFSLMSSLAHWTNDPESLTMRVLFGVKPTQESSDDSSCNYGFLASKEAVTKEEELFDFERIKETRKRKQNEKKLSNILRIPLLVFPSVNGVPIFGFAVDTKTKEEIEQEELFLSILRRIIKEIEEKSNWEFSEVERSVLGFRVSVEIKLQEKSKRSQNQAIMILDVIRLGYFGGGLALLLIEKLTEFFYESMGIVVPRTKHKDKKIETQKDISLFAERLASYIEASDSAKIKAELQKTGTGRERIAARLVSQFYFEESA